MTADPIADMLTRVRNALIARHAKVDVPASRLKNEIARILREEIGENLKLMMDANQVWDVDEAVANMRRLAEFDPWWIEEPTSPDDILGYARIRAAVRRGTALRARHSPR